MQPFTRSVVMVVGAVCLLAACSQNTSGLKHGADAGTGGQTHDGGAGGAKGSGGVVASGGLTGAGGVVASGGSGGVVASGGSGGAAVDAPAKGGSGGDPVPDAAGHGGATGGSGGGTGGAAGGAGGASSACPPVAPCNWCGGTTLYDSAGCISGFRCANGANPCSTSACPGSPCAAGYTCGTDRLCWPGTGGAGGGAGGTGGGGGIVGRGGAGGSSCQQLTCYNWCNGSPVTNSAGCVNGYRCANGANPCNTSACSSDASCNSGYYCKDKMCWPGVGTGGTGNGGATGTGGMASGGGAGGGAGGAGGTTGTGQVGVRCQNALCNTGQICCVSLLSSTVACTGPAECADDFAVTCDGPEDCGSGQRCCMPSGVLNNFCATACLPGLAMCHNDADCSAGETCCSRLMSNAYAYGLCTTGPCPR
jgi:hypothetical protein